MNRLETQETVKRFSRMQPAYAEWRNRQIETNSSANGTDKTEEWSAMLDSIARTLSTVEKREADAVLSRMESGRLPIPPYGELALTVLREARAARQPANRFHDSQPRYQCLNCLDTGITNVWNPRFVESYREEFAKITRKEFDRSKVKDGAFDLDRYDPEGTISAWEYDPPNWVFLARKWWQQRGGEGPVHHVALCDCECKRQKILAEELRAYREGQRRNSVGEQASPPACGCAVYDPNKMPRKTPLSYDDLHTWYATHEVNEVHLAEQFN